MESNKKSQNFSRLVNSKTSQIINSKRKSDLQTTKSSLPRAPPTHRREQSNTSRNEQQQLHRNIKQLPVKQRPRIRSDGAYGSACYGNNNCGGNDVGDRLQNSSERVFNTNAKGVACEGDVACSFADDIFVASSGLAEEIGMTNDNDKKSSYVAVQNESSTKAMRKANNASFLAFGGKKQNLNHLLNFQYARRDYDYASGMNVFGHHYNGYQHHKLSGNRGGGGGMGKKHKYNKEQFLQANFQFVVKSSAKLSVNNSPDAIIDWALIEQINIQTTEEPQCPICLYPPIAAKLTRCGHAYCWPCILHYLALNDKSWRKCPICYEAIHVGDLKSTAILQQHQFVLNETITFQLMRRKKGSLILEKFTNAEASTAERYPFFDCSDNMKNFSKFLIAKRGDILNIIERERRELTVDQDPNCPEHIFVQQALVLLDERLQKLGGIAACKNELEETENASGGLDEQTIENKEQQTSLDATGVESNSASAHLQFHFDPEESIHDEGLYVGESKMDASFNGNDIDLANSCMPQLSSACASTTKYHYFYQSVDGQNIFLHSLNVKMLISSYNSLDRAPCTISARILQKEYETMTEDQRRRYACLRHLPLTCQFAVFEVELREPIVTAAALEQYKKDIMVRQREREKREREENKREKKIAAINDRKMGKMVASYRNLNLGSAQEFPTFGFTETGGSFTSATEPIGINASASSAVELSPSLSHSPVTGANGLSYSSVISAQEAGKATTSKNNFPELSAKYPKNPTHTRAGFVAAPVITVSTRKSTGAKMVKYSNDEDDELTGGGEGDVKSMGATFGDALELAMLAKNKRNKNKDKKAGNARGDNAAATFSAAACGNMKAKTKKGKAKYSSIKADDGLA